jgi:hypothetical protein
MNVDETASEMNISYRKKVSNNELSEIWCSGCAEAVESGLMEFGALRLLRNVGNHLQENMTLQTPSKQRTM